MGKLNDMKVALKTAMETLPDLKVFDQPADSINQFPAMIFRTEPIDYRVVFNNQDMTGTLRCILLVSTKDQQEAFDDIDDYLEITGPKSVRAAIEADKTLGGVVDWIILDRAENIDFREVKPGLFYKGADFLVDYHISDNS